MKAFVFWGVLLSLSVLCPVAWRIASVTTEPVWLGAFITTNLMALRIFFSLCLAGLLAYCVHAAPTRSP